MKPLYVLTLDEHGRPLTWRDGDTGELKRAAPSSSARSRTITRSEAPATATVVEQDDPLAADRARLKTRLLNRRLRALGIRTEPASKPRTIEPGIEAARGFTEL